MNAQIMAAVRGHVANNQVIDPAVVGQMADIIERLEVENAHLRQEIARLKESANKDRAALNLIEDALRGRGRE